MKTKLGVSFLSGFAVLVSFSVFAQSLDTTRIDQVFGMKGVLNTNENVFKVTWPRTDVKVSVDGMNLPPFMGLASWAAFSQGMGQAMVMGDTVLFQDEVNPAMSVALDNGLSVTALHNHFFYDDPKVYFMHIEGQSQPDQLAAAVKKVWDKVKEIRAANPKPAMSFGGTIPAQSSITPKPVEDALGAKAATNNGMVKIVIGNPTKMSGMDVTKDMGANTWAAFAGTDDNAVVDGDFAMHEDELQGVLKALRKGGVNVVAIHQHMTGETPRILFLHFWGKGKASDLANTLKAARDVQK